MVGGQKGITKKNGWTIGTNAEYPSYEEQDIADSQSMYYTLENKIIPAYYAKDENGISKKMDAIHEELNHVNRRKI
ncbi:MAG: hypothetical protein ACLR8F_02920 [Clostridia bacterium]